ncbi:hypothetical protein NDI85_11225 [Halomicroarcula sp. S1AR25-4]|uniref:hypothetical protein n=1 Tax=Haloarcula sp. S1AR25-4 TaxID=2950538 RepID=UPI0028761E9A|nr:hypothetical protein [Halomicroarcula sp. S1AR25-4]MDS0278369.1 hypothetical protein [Halomicroarcula sp. S1AR25-4]
MLSGFLWDFALPFALVAVLLAAVDRYQDTRLLAYLSADRERTVLFVGGIALVVAFVASTYALGSPPPLEGRYDFSLYHVGFAVLLVGVFMTGHGGRHYATATTLRDAAHVAPSDLPTEGTAAVTGTAEPVAGTVTAPHSGESALVAEAGRLVGGETYAATADTSRAQQLLDAERVGVPFEVTDEYGGVRVDPDAVSLAFLVGETDGATLERRVDSGDEVTVVGRADGGRLVDPLVVAHAGNPSLRQFATNVPRVATLGPVLVLLGVGVMLLTAGVV